MKQTTRTLSAILLVMLMLVQCVGVWAAGETTNIWSKDFTDGTSPFTLSYGNDTTSVVAEPGNDTNKVLQFVGKTTADVSWYDTSVNFNLNKPVILSGRIRPERNLSITPANYWSLHFFLMSSTGNQKVVFFNSDGPYTGSDAWLGGSTPNSTWTEFSLKMTKTEKNTISCVLTYGGRTYDAYTVTADAVGEGEFTGIRFWHQEFGETEKLYMDDLTLANETESEDEPATTTGWTEDFESGSHGFTNLSNGECMSVVANPTNSNQKVLSLSATAETVIQFDKEASFTLQKPVTLSGKFLTPQDKSSDTYWDFRVAAKTATGNADLFSITNDTVWLGVMGSGGFAQNQWAANTWYDFSLELSQKASGSDVVVCKLTVAGIPYNAYEITVAGSSTAIPGLHFLSVEKNIATYIDDLKLYIPGEKADNTIWADDFESGSNPFVGAYGNNTSSVVSEADNASNKVLQFKGQTTSDVSWYNKAITFDLSKSVTFSGRFRPYNTATGYWSLHFRLLTAGSAQGQRLFWFNNNGLMLGDGDTPVNTIPNGEWTTFSLKMTKVAANSVQCRLTVNGITYDTYTLTNDILAADSFTALQIQNQDLDNAEKTLYVDDLKLVSEPMSVVFRNQLGIALTQDNIADATKVTVDATSITNYVGDTTPYVVMAVYSGTKLVGCKAIAVTSENGVVTITSDGISGLSNIDDVKLFVWESVSSMRPVFAASCL